jgi:hypothetical protein
VAEQDEIGPNYKQHGQGEADTTGRSRELVSGLGLLVSSVCGVHDHWSKSVECSGESGSIYVGSSSSGRRSSGYEKHQRAAAAGGGDAVCASPAHLRIAAAETRAQPDSIVQLLLQRSQKPNTLEINRLARLLKR